MIGVALDTATRGVLLLSVALFVGTPVVTAAVVGPVCRTASPDRGRAFGRVSVLLGATSAALALAALVRSFGPALRSAALDPTWVARLAVAAGVAVLVRRTVRRGGVDRLLLGGVLAGGLSLVATLGVESTAAASAGTAGAALYGVHLTGAALWTGGLVTLAAVVVPVLSVASDADGTTVRVVERFSLVAAAGVTLAVSTGLVLAGLQVPTVGALVSTAHGVKLLAKVALVAVAAGIGAFTRLVLLRRLRDSSPRRSTADPIDPDPVGGPDVRGDGGLNRDALSLGRVVRIEAAVLVLVVLISTAPVSPPGATVGVADAANDVDAPGAELVGEVTPDWEETVFRLALGGGALGVGVAGTAAVSYEALLFRRYWLPD